MVTYVPGTGETDPKKQNMSLQQIGSKLDTAIANVATLSAAGYVVGPASSTTNGFVVYSDTTGKLVKDHAATIALTSEVSGTLPTANGGLGNTAGAWTTYTPAITSTVGTFTTVSATGGFYVIGKLVHFSVTISVTTVGTASGRINLPIPTGTAIRNFSAHGSETASTLKGISYEVQSGATTGLVTFYDGTFPGASGNTIIVTGIYEQT